MVEYFNACIDEGNEDFIALAEYLQEDKLHGPVAPPNREELEFLLVGRVGERMTPSL